MSKRLIMYTRTAGCPFVTTAKIVLEKHNIPYTEVFIDRDPQAKERLLAWVGFLSVPTLLTADEGEVTPHSTPAPLPPDAISPRGIDRGTMITEPSSAQLEAWLRHNGLLVG